MDNLHTKIDKTLYTPQPVLEHHNDTNHQCMTMLVRRFPQRGGVILGCVVFTIMLIYYLNLQISELHTRYSPDITKIDYSSKHVNEMLRDWQKRHHENVAVNRSSDFETIIDDEFDNVMRNSREHFRSQRKKMRDISWKDIPKVKRKYYSAEDAALYVEPYLVSSAVDEKLNCTTLGAIKPETPICLYNRDEDVYVSEDIRNEGVWEKHIVHKVQDVIRSDLDLGLIDLGANIGQYSLIVASMGHNVLAVEPFTQSLKRFQKAIQIGNLASKIIILKNAISDSRGSAILALSHDNQGDARVQNTDMKHGSGRPCSDTTKCEDVKQILLDDIVPYLKFKKAVLKIDIQGYEHKALLYASHLFDEIYIPYIFMEWLMMREHYVTIVHESQEKYEVMEMIQFLVHREYAVTSMVTGNKLNLDHWEGWPEDVLWTHKMEAIMN